MNQSEMIKVARTAIRKKWDFETLKYGDDLYGNEDFAEEVWEFVKECEKIGTTAFDAKYAGV